MSNPLSTLSRLPSTTSKWKQYVRDADLENETIHTFQNVSSASAIGFDQFLLLQVLWTSKRSTQDLFQSRDNPTGIQQKHYKDAVKDLLQADFWTDYVDSFQIPGLHSLSRPFPNIGSMSQVRYYQLLCTAVPKTDQCTPKFTPMKTRLQTKMAAAKIQQPPQTPTPITGKMASIANYFGDMTLDASPEDASPETPEQSSHIFTFDSPESGDALSPPTEDEQIVNTALLLFLNAITFHFAIPAKWSLQRKAFKFGIDNNKLFEARVDGYLLCIDDDRIKAIIEVKPFVLNSNPDPVQMQEASQMAAWISSDPDPLTRDSTRIFW